MSETPSLNHELNLSDPDNHPSGHASEESIAVGQKIEQNIESKEKSLKVIEFLERTGFLELAFDDEKFKEWKDGLDYNSFKEHLIRINGLIKEESKNNRGLTEEAQKITNFRGTKYMAPEPEDRDELLLDVFEGVRSIENRKDAGLLLYLSLQEIHPFVDGNGRTGRLLYTLLASEGASIEEQKEYIKSITEHKSEIDDSGRDKFSSKVRTPVAMEVAVTQLMAKDILGANTISKYNAINTNIINSTWIIDNMPQVEGVAGKDTEKAGQILEQTIGNNFNYRGLLLYRLVEEKGQLEDYCLPKLSNIKTGDKSTLSLDGQQIVRNLDKNNIRRIIEIERDMKVKLIKTMIDTIKNPQRYRLSNGKPIKDFYYNM